MRISEDVLGQAVTGVNLMPGSLGDQLGQDPVLLVFLRHFGCIFCRETLADLSEEVAKDPVFPSPLFFFMGNPMEGKAFLRRYDSRFRAVSDPDAIFYRAFGIERGGMLEMFRPRVLVAANRAREKGHRNGTREGDIWRLPGVFLVHRRSIVWRHEYRHAADHPNYGVIRNEAAKLR